MNDFHFHAPETMSEAVSLLKDHGDDAKVMAGGTSLTLLLKQSLVQPDHIISLHRVQEARSIEFTDGTLRVGGLVTQREMEKSDLVKKHAPLLAEAYRRVATVRIRNVATVGGGLAQADPAMDPPPSLLILGAKVKLTSPSGDRLVSISDWYTDYYETVIEPDEIVSELQVQAQPAGSSWTYIKYLPRTEDDYATVSVAALGVVENGSITDVRVGLGAVAPTALRANDVESSLTGDAPSRERLSEVSQSVLEIVDPTSDPRGSADYKRDMSAVFTRRALEQVLGL